MEFGWKFSPKDPTRENLPEPLWGAEGLPSGYIPRPNLPSKQICIRYSKRREQSLFESKRQKRGISHFANSVHNEDLKKIKPPGQKQDQAAAGRAR